jgi:4-amino-4-deoxy-L-arabinose transferase-like glycosyltransferase
VTRRGDALAVALLVAVWAMVIAVVGLGGDFALNDDWAYASSARGLLHTGHLRISDWAAPSLGTHALWGAGALALFGESFVSLRIGSLAWGLWAMIAAYALARTVLSPRASALAALAFGLSPWFLNLSFTYMTEAHWMALVLSALVVFARAVDPRLARAPAAWMLALSGALIGAAATTRQFAVITAPGFVAALAVEARLRLRGERERAWLRETVKGSATFAAPMVAIFGSFYTWYTKVHGPTSANRDTITRILAVRPWHVLLHGAVTWHYAGLWLFPVALALVFRRELGALVTRRTLRVSLFLLAAFALVRLSIGALLEARDEAFDHPEKAYHALMPYLGNVFYAIGLGPQTLTDVYRDHNAGTLHGGAWFGALLTIASTFGGVLVAALFLREWRATRRAWRRDVEETPADEDREPSAGSRRAVLRVLLVGYIVTYLAYQLGTGTFLFDRYLLPILPAVVLLALDAAPAAARSPAIPACLAVVGLFSAFATREYMSWNEARSKAVAALIAKGVPADLIDGGFEINGPLQFDRYLARTGDRLGDNRYFWIVDAPYVISFRPARHPGCTVVARFPFWTWPGGGSPAIAALDCSRNPAAGSAAQ